jgi:hypothetical protein
MMTRQMLGFQQLQAEIAIRFKFAGGIMASGPALSMTRPAAFAQDA